MVKVSIVLPVFDCVKYFRASMESLGRQTLQDFDIVIVDDCCRDGTEKMIDIYAQDPRVQLIRHEHNKGLGESLNDGLVRAQGEYIAIQHADDISLPERLEKQVAYLDAHSNVHLAGAWTQYIDDCGKIKKKDGWWLRQIKKVPDDPETIRNHLQNGFNCIVHSSVMFRKTVGGTVGFYDNDMVPAEDLDFWLRISEKHDIGIIHEVLTQYRHHPDQLTNTAGPEKISDYVQLAVDRAKRRRNASHHHTQ